MSDFWLQIIITVIVSSLGIGALILALRKEKPDIKKTDKETDKIKTEAEKISGADTVETFAKAAEISSNQVIKLYSRMDDLDIKVKELVDTCLKKDCEIAQLENKIKERDGRILMLEKIVEDSKQRIQELEREVEILRNKEENK